MGNHQINAVIDANNAAVAAGDIEAILSTFEAGGVMQGQPGMMAEGTDALREAFQQFVGMKPQISVTGQEVIQADDIAVHSSTWTMQATALDGTAFAQDGFSVVVLREQTDGTWLMVIDNPFDDLLLKNH